MNGWAGRITWILIPAVIGAVTGIAAARLDVEARMVRVETILKEQQRILERITEQQLKLIQDTSYIKARLKEEQ